MRPGHGVHDHRVGRRVVAYLLGDVENTWYRLRWDYIHTLVHAALGELEKTPPRVITGIAAEVIEGVHVNALGGTVGSTGVGACTVESDHAGSPVVLNIVELHGPVVAAGEPDPTAGHDAVVSVELELLRRLGMGVEADAGGRHGVGGQGRRGEKK